MALKEPESVDECVYFTRRKLEGDGQVVAWVFKGKCPACKQALMGKPTDPSTGSIKIRAKEYVCPKCGHMMTKDEYEPTLTCNIQYTCPNCSHKGEKQTPYQRKSFQGTKAIVFDCDACGTKIPITKKMAKTKEKE
jgi:predicted RNA-binding Zn-ribbon protein involved in translation (DUF1610 family)